jgi:hypothetical protein
VLFRCSEVRNRVVFGGAVGGFASAGAGYSALDADADVAVLPATMTEAAAAALRALTALAAAVAARSARRAGNRWTATAAISAVTGSVGDPARSTLVAPWVTEMPPGVCTIRRQPPPRSPRAAACRRRSSPQPIHCDDGRRRQASLG